MIVINVTGFEQASIFINQRLGSLDRSGLMQAVGALVEAQTKRRIASEKTSPDGATWAPLKPATVAKKGSANVLVDTGRLLGSISHISGSSFAIVGTNVYYAKFHQGGTSRVTARAFVGLSSDNRSELERVIHGFIARQIG